MKLKNLLLLFLFSLNSALFPQSAYAAAPNITLKFTNVTQQLNDFKGKLIYVDFWATWCVPCRKSFPWMNEIHEKYKTKGFEIIAINLDKDTAQVSKFLEKYPAKFKIAYDPEGTTAKTFNVQTMPSSFLINQQGNIIFKYRGFRKNDTSKIERIIQSNL